MTGGSTPDAQWFKLKPPSVFRGRSLKVQSVFINDVIPIETDGGNVAPVQLLSLYTATHCPPAFALSFNNGRIVFAVASLEIEGVWRSSYAEVRGACDVYVCAFFFPIWPGRRRCERLERDL